MEHNQLTHQHRAMWMVKKGLFYCVCPSCGGHNVALSGDIEEKGYFYYSLGPCKKCLDDVSKNTTFYF